MLRQAVAIHCGTYACILYCESKAKQCLVWIGIAFFMHVSSIILLSIYLYPFVKKLNNKWLEIILIISFIGSFFLNLKTFSFCIPLSLFYFSRRWGCVCSANTKYPHGDMNSKNKLPLLGRGVNLFENFW